ncbi:MAG: hypothetical protein EAZ32_11070 [Cytophagia bacterium]|nr:MAG: hypothetical protein EAZ38_00695 [Cytophagales bacterium]TAG39045.1 MAG: hypothetical protein EAZ32_11070 [Cytophagia bacterium]TAG84293.1 MAG: hypothetical protein EAZ22_00860 [Cytophagales bacterium]
MFSNKDYSKMTLEELVLEETKMKSGATASAFFIGMLVGIAVWSATSGKFLITIGLLSVAFFVGHKNSQTNKAIQAEIIRKKSVDQLFC